MAPDISTSDDLPWLRMAVGQAREAGIRVSALGGDSSWVDQPAAALDWIAAALRTGLFEGVHVDLEAWAHRQWEGQRPEVVARYLRVLQQLADATPLPLEVDMAHWLHEVPTAGGDSLDAAVMRIADAVTVLSYRNTATGKDSITDIGAAELGSASRAGVRCRLSVETGYLGPRPVDRKQTFHGLGQAPLNRALAAVDRMQSVQPAYAGMAVHHFQTWRDLRRRSRPGR